MKNKPLTIVLLGAVVLIWAWIMYSVFDYMDSPDVTPLKKKTASKVFKEDTVVNDYVLVLNYKDPFLKKEYLSIKTISQNSVQNQYVSQQNNTTVRIPKKTEKKEPVKEEIPMPIIQYVGRIHNAKLNKPIAILIIDDHEYMMQEGQENNGVMLKQIVSDSVKVMFSKKMFYVKKS